jgi:DNA-binding NarL/FixJ family response regulator
LIKRFQCIIIDPELPSRMKLKSAATSAQNVGTVHAVNGYEAAAPYLTDSEEVDVVFVSGAYEKHVLTEIIEVGKKTPQGQDAAFVVVLKNQTDSSSEVGSYMILGADGILSEPYSVDQLDRITKLSVKIRAERAEERQRIALTLMINDVIQQIDLLACLKASQCELGTSIRAFREMCGPLHALTDAQLEIYLSLAVEEFSKAPLPQRSFTASSYTGVSRRLRRRMESKIENEIAAVSAAAGQRKLTE